MTSLSEVMNKGRVVYFVVNEKLKSNVSGKIKKMKKGKLTAQVSHASLQVYQTSAFYDEWEANGFQAKIYGQDCSDSHRLDLPPFRIVPKIKKDYK